MMMSSTELSRQDLLLVATEIGSDWEDLASSLNVGAAKTPYHLRRDIPGRIFNLLLNWQRQLPTGVHQTGRLRDELNKINREDIGIKLTSTHDLLVQNITESRY